MIRIPFAMACIVALSSCAKAIVPQSVETGPPSGDAVANMIEVLKKAWSAETAANAVWPGFSLHAQTLGVHRPDGPVALATNIDPPSGFTRIDGSPPIHILRATPPDSLAGMRVGLTWAGRPFAATIVPYNGPTTLHTLIHESFHTFQRSRRAAGEFAGGGGNVDLTRITPEAIQMILLESGALGEALEARDPQRKRLLQDMLALRHLRCTDIAPQSCAAERVIEHREGSADYVASETLARINVRSAQPVIDLVRKLDSIPNVEHLGRFHFYDRGHAMLRIIAAMQPAGWQRAAATASPDSLLARLVAFDTTRAAARARDLLRSSNAIAAKRSADLLMARRKAAQDSVIHAFNAQPGIPIRFYPGAFPSRGTSDPNAINASIARGAETVSYSVKLRESRMWYGDGAKSSVHRVAVSTVCCEEFSVMAIGEVRGRTIDVGGETIPLDAAGSTKRGAVKLALPNIEVSAPDAIVTIYADSITIRGQ